MTRNTKYTAILCYIGDGTYRLMISDKTGVLDIKEFPGSYVCTEKGVKSLFRGYGYRKMKL